MSIFKKLLKKDTKEEHAEKIPDSLSSSDFNFHQTFQHGFPHQPSSIAYDSVQRLLAIGSHSGTILIIGKSGLECHFRHGIGVGVIQLSFVENKGHLISRCNDNSLYLWSLETRSPQIVHKLEFQREQMSHMYLPYGCEWLYVGMEGGNLYVVNVEEFSLSGYNIYWEKIVEPGIRKQKPGSVLAIEENPCDTSKILISFSEGLCVIWSLKGNGIEKRYKHETAGITVLMGVAWHGSGKQFAGAYSDGSIAIFNIKSDGKPEKVFSPHNSQSSSSSPIAQLQWYYTEPDPWLIFSGGDPNRDGSSTRTVTIFSPQKMIMKHLDHPVVEFICLRSSPFASDIQKPFALAVLTQHNLCMFDLESPGFPNYSIPFSLDIHNSPVTCIEYCGNCPDDFIAQLHSVKSKLPQQKTSTKQWPLRGGVWGMESPDPWTDLIITGHLDGSVRLWFCRSVIMQPLFTISTTCFFNEAMSPLATPMDKAAATPTSVHTPVSSRSPRNSPVLPFSPQLSPQLQIEMDETTPNPTTPTAKPIKPSVLHLPEGGANDIDEGRGCITPSPNMERKFRKGVFEKSKKDKKKKKDKGGKKTRLSSNFDDSDNQSIPSPPRSPLLIPKLIHQDIKEEKKDDDKTSHLAHPSQEFMKSKSTTLPNIFFKIKSDENREKSSTSEKEAEPFKSHDYIVVSPNSCNHDNRDMEDVAIHQMSISPHSQTICVANVTGHCFAFNFSLVPINRKPQTLAINMLNDSVIPGAASVSSPSDVFIQSALSFNDSLIQQLPGFYVVQHCYCYSEDCGGVDITAVKYWPFNGLLIIGSDVGLVIVSTLHNQILKVLNNLTSLLYLADPNSYTKLVRKMTQELPQIHKNKTCPEISRQYMLSQRNETLPLIIPSIQLREGNNQSSSSKRKKSDSLTDYVITSIELVQMFINKSQPITFTLWIGTFSGHIAVYSIQNVTSSPGKKSIQLHPTGLTFNLKSPVVSLHFLSEWGEQLVTPYKSHIHSDQDTSPEVVAVARRQETARGVSSSEKPVNFAVIVTKEAIKSMGLPGDHEINSITPSDAYHIIYSGLFTCNGLPCLSIILSNGCIFIYTLPGLKLVLQYQHEPLTEPKILYSYRVSGNGQCLYQLSPSQFQRLSVTSVDHLNIPLAYPELYVPIEGPVPLSKGMLNDLFIGLTSPAAINRDKVFGYEAAGRGWRSVARKDDTYERVKQRPAGRGSIRSGGQSTASSTGGGGATNAFSKARQGLDERGEKLSETAIIAENLHKDSEDFAALAAKLAEKYRKK